MSTTTVDFSNEIRKLEQKARKLQKEVFADLSAQQKVQLARHPARPYMNDYIALLMTLPGLALFYAGMVPGRRPLHCRP